MLSDKIPQCREPAVEKRYPRRYSHVTLEFELSYGIQSIGGTWVTDHKHDVVFLDTVLSPAKVMISLIRVAVVVKEGEKGEMEGVTRVCEVVRIAAKGTYL
jgi:hypothetical protein